MKRVRITKISANDDFIYPTPSSEEEYQSNKYTGKYSIPVGYEVEGYLVDPLKVGESARITRTVKGVIKFSSKVFITSPVREITETGFSTVNSVYTMEAIESD